ncbi:MAG: putative sensor, partial [Paenibacillus sp.]|nr:putative sensor [Paenibacillus sp.]
MEKIKWIRWAVTTIRNMKLQQKLMGGYLLGCVIPVLVVSTIIYSQSVRGLEGASQEFATLYTSQIENSLDQLMQEYDKITKSVLVDNDLISRLRSSQKISMDELILQKEMVRRVLMRVALLKPEIDTVMLVSPNYTVYQYSNNTATVDENALLAQDWYKLPRNTSDSFFVTGLHDRSHYGEKADGANVTVGRVLLNSDGAFAGWLLLDLDPFSLLAPNPDFVLARDKYDMKVIISNSVGLTVYHSDAASGRVAWKDILNSKVDYTKDTSDADRIVITGSTKLGNLIIKTEIPRQKLLLRIRKIQVITGIVILAGFIIMAFISLGLNYAITKPIKSLRRSMKQAEAGMYMPINNLLTHDEIGSLVHSYNKMIVTIRTLIESVYIAEIKQRQAQFLALQNQINPHMLYNTLESIRMK